MLQVPLHLCTVFVWNNIKHIDYSQKTCAVFLSNICYAQGENNLFMIFMSSLSSAEFRKNEMFLNLGSNYSKLKSS